jgi:CubicO group peptidase (beta-lactamase class C family)
MSPDSLRHDLEALLQEGVRDRVFTQAAVAVVRDGDLFAAATHDVEAIFDVASVTKVATAVLAVKHLPLDQPLPHLDGQMTFREQLAHTSGLPAWRPFYAMAAEKLGVTLPELIGRTDLHQEAKVFIRRVIGQTPATAPKPTYSDLNFILLGSGIEAYAGLPLPLVARRDIFDLLDLESMHWGGTNERAVSTGTGRPRPGNPAVEPDFQALTPFEPNATDHAVDDDNAAALGGIAGHAGLWSSAPDLARLGDELRRCAEGTSTTLLTREQAQLLFTRAAGSRTYGLDTPSGETPSIGTILGRGPKGAAGHLGFTGCSLWIDRDAELSIALLSNAVAVERPNPRIRAFRPRVHDLIATGLGLSQP